MGRLLGRRKRDAALLCVSLVAAACGKDAEHDSNGVVGAPDASDASVDAGASGTAGASGAGAAGTGGAAGVGAVAGGGAAGAGADADGDGYSIPADCNDDDKDVNPAATESCNGIDDNCAGGIDDGVKTTFYADSDGDGHGGATTQDACVPPGSKWVLQNDDCDDKDPFSFPGATETCDGKDQDCDGVIDDVAGTKSFWADCDYDGYAALGAEHVKVCSWPSSKPTTCPGGGWSTYEPTAASNDCNDSNPALNPVGYDDCQFKADGIDQDCDGVVDGRLWYPSCDGDGFAMAGAGAYAVASCSKPTAPPSICGGTGGWVHSEKGVLPVDCDDTKPLVHAFATFQTSPDPTWGWDYDCNGSIERQYLGTGVSASDACYPWAQFGCGGADGWIGSALPDCGQSAELSECGCSTTGNSSTAACLPYYGCYCSPCARTTKLVVQGCR